MRSWTRTREKNIFHRRPLPPGLREQGQVPRWTDIYGQTEEIKRQGQARAKTLRNGRQSCYCEEVLRSRCFRQQPQVKRHPCRQANMKCQTETTWSTDDERVDRLSRSLKAVFVEMRGPAARCTLAKELVRGGWSKVHSSIHHEGGRAEKAE